MVLVSPYVGIEEGVSFSWLTRNIMETRGVSIEVWTSSMVIPSIEARWGWKTTAGCWRLSANVHTLVDFFIIFIWVQLVGHTLVVLWIRGAWICSQGSLLTGLWRTLYSTQYWTEVVCRASLVISLLSLMCILIPFSQQNLWHQWYQLCCCVSEILVHRLCDEVNLEL